MNNICKVKSITLWIFIVPFIGINLCLILVTQFHGLFPNQEDIIHNTFPYFDGGASISRTARVFPTYLIFKPAMFLTSYLLIKYWYYNKAIINSIDKENSLQPNTLKSWAISNISPDFDVIEKIISYLALEFKNYKPVSNSVDNYYLKDNVKIPNQ